MKKKFIAILIGVIILASIATAGITSLTNRDILVDKRISDKAKAEESALIYNLVEYGGNKYVCIYDSKHLKVSNINCEIYTEGEEQKTIEKMVNKNFEEKENKVIVKQIESGKITIKERK